MPVVAAPLEALAALGMYTLFSRRCLMDPEVCAVICEIGFILAGIPIYYLSMRKSRRDDREDEEGWFGGYSFMVE